MERFRMQFVKKVQFEKLYVLICLRPRSENVAIPHPPLRGTFPPGEGILQFHDQLIKADNLNYNLLHHRTIPSGAGQKRLHQSTARLGRPPCGQIPIYLFAEQR